jgi:hypothetical protein
MPAAAPPRAFLGLLLLAAVCGAGTLQAQTQESGTLDRIVHPDRTLKYDDADRKFDAPAAEVGKQAAVHPFLFSHSATLKAGDGVFQTHEFSSKGFGTKDFATKPAFTKEYDVNGKLFAVRAVPVNEDRAAGKTMDTHTYMNADKPYLVRGKRQDTLDEIHDAKKMTIEQVRELLNKPR